MSEQPFMDRCLVLEARVKELEAYLREECMECDYCRAGARDLLNAAKPPEVR